MTHYDILKLKQIGIFMKLDHSIKCGARFNCVWAVVRALTYTHIKRLYPNEVLGLKLFSLSHLAC